VDKTNDRRRAHIENAFLPYQASKTPAIDFAPAKWQVNGRKNGAEHEVIMSHQYSYQTIGEYSIDSKSIERIVGGSNTVKPKTEKSRGPSLIARIVNYLRERIALAKAKRELFAMNDRELADIGLYRGDIAARLSQAFKNQQPA
jgi:uncharacterized protein YjiS (DUF1127 family)